MRRLMAMIAECRADLTPLVTHRFALDDIEEAFDLFRPPARRGDEGGASSGGRAEPGPCRRRGARGRCVGADVGVASINERQSGSSITRLPL
jgi:hypothetical protein